MADACAALFLPFENDVVGCITMITPYQRGFSLYNL